MYYPKELIKIIRHSSSALFPLTQTTSTGKTEEPSLSQAKPPGNPRFKILASKWPLLSHNILDHFMLTKKKNLQGKMMKLLELTSPMQP